MYKDACTRFLYAPVGAVVKPVFLDEDYTHLCNITEAVSMDNASNEVTATQDMLSTDPVAAELDIGFLPNCIWSLKDVAHAFRRMLSRLWAADKVMKMWSACSAIGETRQLN